MEAGKDNDCFMAVIIAAVSTAENRKVGCAIEVSLLPMQMLGGRSLYAGVYCAAVIIAAL